MMSERYESMCVGACVSLRSCVCIVRGKPWVLVLAFQPLLVAYRRRGDSPVPISHPVVQVLACLYDNHVTTEPSP